MPYNYSDEFLTKRASGGGKDPGRKRTADELAAKAQAGDKSALMELINLSGGPGDPDPSSNWATQDARNYGMMKLRDLLPGYTPQYGKAHDGSFSLGHFLGGVLEYAAPIGAAFIPGIGPLAAGAIAAGGTGVGRAIGGKPFSLKSELLAGAGGAGGNLLLGGQGASGISGVPARLGIGGGGATTVGNATQSMPGVMGAATEGATAVPGAAGGILGSGISGKDIMRYLPLATGALGAYGAYQNAHKANELRDRALQMADQRNSELAPFRLKATEYMQQGPPQAPDFSSDFADPNNPYYRPLKPYRPSTAAGGSY